MKKNTLFFISLLINFYSFGQAISFDSLKAELKGKWTMKGSFSHKLCFNDTYGTFKGYAGRYEISTSFWKPCIISSDCKDKDQTDKLGTGYYLEFTIGTFKKKKSFISIRKVTNNNLMLFYPGDKTIGIYTK